MAENEIERNVAETFKTISQVDGIYIVPNGDIVNVFTIIRDDDEAVYDVIYARERSLIRHFSSTNFDFNVIARRGRSIAEIVGCNTPVWQRDGAGEECLSATNI